MQKNSLKKYLLPQAPGVYYFKRCTEILYIGKATSLKDRVRSYFSNDVIKTRGVRIVDMVTKATSISFRETTNVLEALILETAEIKKYQPRYNVESKDDKSFNHVIITEEDFPRVLLVRGHELENKHDYKIRELFGPFPSAHSLRIALKIIRKVFPFFDAQCAPGMKQRNVNHEIGICPDPDISKQEYKKTIARITLFLSGRTEKLTASLQKDMSIAVKNEAFENAEKIKRILFALQHINDVALIKDDVREAQKQICIEAFDVAHMSGKDVVGVLVSFDGVTADKKGYRKFKLSQEINNDIRNLEEILTRRLLHEEWKLPEVIVVDGGIAQKDIAQKTIKHILGDDSIAVVAVTKDARHRARNIHGDSVLIKKYSDAIIQANAEAHRFAIAYHRQLRSKQLRR